LINVTCVPVDIIKVVFQWIPFKSNASVSPMHEPNVLGDETDDLSRIAVTLIQYDPKRRAQKRHVSLL